MNRISWKVYLAMLVVLSLGFAGYRALQPGKDLPFNGDKAMQHIETQMAFGPRIPNSEAHAEFIQWAGKELGANGWQVEDQTGESNGHPLTNIIGRKGSGKQIIILSAHYDSRLVADQDQGYPSVNEPVPGANDGASGVAILLELSRVLKIPDDKQIWIVLFDIEDNGNLPGWDWIMGSRYFADHLEQIPSVLINLDMVGDADLNIYKEKTSNALINDEIWQIAEQLGFGDQFIPEYAYSILDDHTPFLEKGIKAIDIIDMDYPYWHTRQDDISRVSIESLQIVGTVIQKWVE